MSYMKIMLCKVSYNIVFLKKFITNLALLLKEFFDFHSR